MLGAIRSMSRFASEVPDLFLIGESFDVFFSIVPDCMAAGDGQGALYILPILVQISTKLSRTAYTDKKNYEKDIHRILESVVKFGIMGTVRKAISFLELNRENIHEPVGCSGRAISANWHTRR